jgi:hypothetical protein
MCQNKYKTKFAFLFERMSLPTSTDKKETQNFPPKKGNPEGSDCKVIYD